MGGDSGGNDCVHVHDVTGRAGAAFSVSLSTELHPETDVVIMDEHGNVCQFTFSEWHAFRAKIRAGDFDHIATDVPPIAAAHGNAEHLRDVAEALEGMAHAPHVGRALEVPKIATPASRLDGTGERHVEAWDPTCNCSGTDHPIGQPDICALEVRS